MLVNYKVCFKKGSSFQFFGETEYSYKDYWTTIQMEDGLTDGQAKYYAKKNLMIQVSKDIMGNARYWKRVYIDVSDMVVERG